MQHKLICLPCGKLQQRVKQEKGPHARIRLAIPKEAACCRFLPNEKPPNKGPPQNYLLHSAPCAKGDAEHKKLKVTCAKDDAEHKKLKVTCAKGDAEHKK